MGDSIEDAYKLDIKYCQVRCEKDETFDYQNCLERKYNFVKYAEEGNAGLSLIRNNFNNWSGYVIVMSSKNPLWKEEDYKSVVMHEYFHVYQHAHIYTKSEIERENLMIKNPWWSEGGAEYMASLLYSKQPGVKSNYLKNKMRNKMRSIKSLENGENIKNLTYDDERSYVAYDLGSWFIAFLINETSEESYFIDFYKDLNNYSFEEAFQKNFGRSSHQFLELFHEHFLKLDIKEQIKIIP